MMFVYNGKNYIKLVLLQYLTNIIHAKMNFYYFYSKNGFLAPFIQIKRPHPKKVGSIRLQKISFWFLLYSPK